MDKHEKLLTGLTLQFDADHWFPFVEDENCNITGPLHQDRKAFAAAVNRYDEVCSGNPYPESEQWDDTVVNHRWVRLDADGEKFATVQAGNPDAFPVTTLWGQR